MSFPVKQRVRFSVNVQDSSLAYVDPATLVFKVKDPDGAVTSYTYLTDIGLVRDSLGHYHLDLVLADPGKWTFRAEGSGNMNVAKEIYTISERSEFYT